MNTKFIYLISILTISILTLMLSSCRTGHKVTTVIPASSTTHTRIDGVAQSTQINPTANNALPKAVIYKMNGDYAQYVPIVLSRNGKQIQSYPAPTDLTASSTPVPIGDGWYFDRRGSIGSNTAFTSYTYDQYRALSVAPSVSDLLSHIIQGAKVTEFKTTPVLFSDALANPSLLDQYK